jgi:hypothetical protein
MVHSKDQLTEKLIYWIPLVFTLFVAADRKLTTWIGVNKMRKRWRVAEQTLATTQAEWQGTQAERSQFQPRAPYAGYFFMSDPDLAAGQ